MQHPILVPQFHMANQTLRLGDGGVAQDLVCRKDLDGLGDPTTMHRSKE